MVSVVAAMVKSPVTALNSMLPFFPRIFTVPSACTSKGEPLSPKIATTLLLKPEMSSSTEKPSSEVKDASAPSMVKPVEPSNDALPFNPLPISSPSPAPMPVRPT